MGYFRNEEEDIVEFVPRNDIDTCWVVVGPFAVQIKYWKGAQLEIDVQPNGNEGPGTLSLQRVKESLVRDCGGKTYIEMEES